MRNRFLQMIILTGLISQACGNEADGDNQNELNETDSFLPDTSSDMSSEGDVGTDDTETAFSHPCVEAFQNATVLRDEVTDTERVLQIAQDGNTVYYGFSKEGIYKMDAATRSPELFVETPGVDPYPAEYDGYIYWMSEEEGNLYRFPVGAASAQSELVLEANEGYLYPWRFAVDDQGFFYYEHKLASQYAVSRRRIGSTDEPEQIYKSSWPPRIALEGETLYITWASFPDGKIYAYSTIDLTNQLFLTDYEFVSFAYREGTFAYAFSFDGLALYDTAADARTELLAPAQELDNLVFYNDRLYWSSSEYLGWSSLDGTYCELIYQMTDDQSFGLHGITVTDAGLFLAFSTVLDNGFYFVPHL